MDLPFQTHDIYIIYVHGTSENKWTTIHRLNTDLTTTVTKNNSLPKPTKPFLFINQIHFNTAKTFLFDLLNPLKISTEEAYFYHKIGFITNEELQTFLNN